jgi:hypothetical protein
MSNTQSALPLSGIRDNLGRGSVGQFLREKIKKGSKPIPTPTETQKTAIENRVTQILTAKRANPAADVAALEAQIDQLVYQLYDLTDEEIAIVEGRAG